MTKLLVIALDGATLNLLEPWMLEGKLPLLARLFNEGSGGLLTSTVPWATPTAFASFATGTNPGKHGVYDFGRLIGENYTAFVPTNGSNVHGRSLWRILSDAGLKSVVINMPMTYPAEVINGFLVSGIPYPGGSSRLCYPSDILNQLKDRGWDLSRNASDDLGGNYSSYFDGLINLVKTRSEATVWLLDHYKPDFAAVHFLETDQVQHRFWQFMPGEPRYDPEGQHTNRILELFQESERGMSKIIEALGEDVMVCVMSDHGFGPTRHQVWLNNWLMQNGFLVLKSTIGVKLKKQIYRTGLSPAAIREAAPERLKLAILQYFERQKGRAIASDNEAKSANVQRKGLMDWLTERLAIDFYDVNWQKTKAFSTGTTSVGYVWINLAGRDPQGIVQPGLEYAKTRVEIADSLHQWPPVGEVIFREDMWQGPRLEEAPDIIVKWAEPTTDARYFQTRVSSHHLIKPVPNDYAGHRIDGMFVFHGPDVVPGQSLEADILDLPATFLWLLQQPVPNYMDGRVLSGIFTLNREVKYQDVAYERENNLPEELSLEDEASIQETLRGLGYIE